VRRRETSSRSLAVMWRSIGLKFSAAIAVCMSDVDVDALLHELPTMC